MNKIIICDIDGTVALKGDRNPYNAASSDYDKLNAPVAKLLDILSAAKVEIIFVSARSEKDRSVTEKWLAVHGFEWNYLFMREDGDNRKDAIIKEELYRKHIEGRYDILFVLDDRNQTVEMWRKIGLPCFQVEEGDF